MSVWQIILGILMLLISLVLIGVILLQQGHRAGVNGAISGAADTFLSKNQARTVNAKLARYTKYGVIVFFVIALIAAALALR